MLRACIVAVVLFALCALPAGAQSLTRQAKLHSPLRDAPPINGNPNYPAASAFGGAMSVSGPRAAIGEAGPFGDRLVRIFERDAAGQWIAAHTITAPQDLDASQKAGFGQEYSLDGQRLAMVIQGHVGPPLVILFEESAGTWQESARIPAQPHFQLNGSFGQGGVVLSGDTLAIGSPGGSLGAYGVVHVFVRQGSAWSLQQVVSENDPYPAAKFGYNFALQGDRLVINRAGARFEESTSSGVYVFERHAGIWSQTAKITQPPPALPGGFIVGYFGLSLALDGERLAILDQELRDVGGSGYPFDIVRVHERNASGQWPLVASLDTGAIHQGNPAPLLSIALQGDRMLVGQVYLDTDLAAGTSPKVFLFERSADSWSAARALSPFDWTLGWVVGADEKVRYGAGFGDRNRTNGLAFDDRGAAFVAAHLDGLGQYGYRAPGAVYLLTDSTGIFCNGFEDNDPARCEGMRNHVMPPQ